LHLRGRSRQACEILFRGFLLPAFAIAYDWISLPRTPAAREQWHLTNKLTRPSLVFSAVLTPHHFHEHAVHQDFFRAHMATKGRELAEACLAIVENLAAVA